MHSCRSLTCRTAPVAGVFCIDNITQQTRATKRIRGCCTLVDLFFFFCAEIEDCHVGSGFIGEPESAAGVGRDQDPHS